MMQRCNELYRGDLIEHVILGEGVRVTKVMPIGPWCVSWWQGFKPDPGWDERVLRRALSKLSGGCHPGKDLPVFGSTEHRPMCAEKWQGTRVA